jgi:hypothetical protein
VAPVDPYLLSPSPEVRPPTPATVRLFGPQAIAAHTVVLTPFVGSLLAAANHRRLGNGAAARHTLLAFTLPGALLVVAELVAINHPIEAVIRLAGFAWTVSVAYRLFNEHQVLFAKHVTSGGQAARWYLATLAVVGIVVVGLALVFASELLTSPRGTE